MPFVKIVKKKLYGYLIKDVPSFVIIDGHIIYLDPEDRLELSIRGSYEPNEVEILKKLIRPGDIVLDVGAHIGHHTLTMARLVGTKGKVVAFEPDPFNFVILEKNITANKYSNIVAIKKGIAESTKKEGGIFYYPKDNKAGSMIEDLTKPKGQTIKIDTVSLDDFIENNLDSKVDFIKIDVDGGEHFVIEGMRSTLKKNPLVLLMEFNPNEMRNSGYNPEKDFELLQSNGFKIYSLGDNEKEIIEINNIERMIGRDLLCIKGRKESLL